MNCSKCNSELRATDKFCSNCGAKVESSLSNKLIEELSDNRYGNNDQVIKIINDLDLKYNSYNLGLMHSNNEFYVLTKLIFDRGYIELSEPNGHLAISMDNFAEYDTKRKSMLVEKWENLTVEKVESYIKKYLDKVK